MGAIIQDGNVARRLIGAEFNQRSWALCREWVVKNKVVDLVDARSTVIFVMPRRTVWKVSYSAPGQVLS